MIMKAMDIILLGYKTHITQDLVLLQTLAQSPLDFRQTKPVSKFVLVRVNERILLCNPYFLGGTQVAWQLRHCWIA